MQCIFLTSIEVMAYASNIIHILHLWYHHIRIIPVIPRIRLCPNNELETTLPLQLAHSQVSENISKSGPSWSLFQVVFTTRSVNETYYPGEYGLKLFPRHRHDFLAFLVGEMIVVFPPGVLKYSPVVSICSFLILLFDTTEPGAIIPAQGSVSK